MRIIVTAALFVLLPLNVFAVSSDEAHKREYDQDQAEMDRFNKTHAADSKGDFGLVRNTGELRVVRAFLAKRELKPFGADMTIHQFNFERQDGKQWELHESQKNTKLPWEDFSIVLNRPISGANEYFTVLKSRIVPKKDHSQHETWWMTISDTGRITHVRHTLEKGKLGGGIVVPQRLLKVPPGAPQDVWDEVIGFLKSQ